VACYGPSFFPDSVRAVVENLQRHPKVAYASYKDRRIIGYPEMTQARFLVHLHEGISHFLMLVRLFLSKITLRSV
jgi:hypothetical protein